MFSFYMLQSIVNSLVTASKSMFFTVKMSNQIIGLKTNVLAHSTITLKSKFLGNPSTQRNCGLNVSIWVPSIIRIETN